MSQPGDDIYGSPEHQAFRETVHRFVQGHVPRAREFDVKQYVARMLRL